MKEEKIKKSVKDMAILDVHVNGKRTNAFVLHTEQDYNVFDSQIKDSRILYFPEHHKLIQEIRIANDNFGESLTPASRTLVLLAKNVTMQDLDEELALNKAFIKQLLSLEDEIWKVYSEGKRCPINNEDWTDAHQEYLEYQEFKEELDGMYQQTQAEYIQYLDRHSMKHCLKIKTAKEYYEKQKDFEDYCKELRDSEEE